MPKRTIPRKARFEAALKLAGQTAAEFAAASGVSATHLYYVVSGERDSQRLIALIDAYIAKHLSSLTPAA